MWDQNQNSQRKSFSGMWQNGEKKLSDRLSEISLGNIVKRQMGGGVLITGIKSFWTW